MLLYNRILHPPYVVVGPTPHTYTHLLYSFLLRGLARSAHYFRKLLSFSLFFLLSVKGHRAFFLFSCVDFLIRICLVLFNPPDHKSMPST